MTRRRPIVILTFDGFQPLDAIGPSQVFTGGEQLRAGTYDVIMASVAGGLVRAEAGPVALDTVPVARLPRQLDTVIVAGGFGARRAARDGELVDAVRQLATGSRRVGSVCTGAFLLAAAGLLDGRRATTHWASVDELARRHPAVTVERDPIFVRDGSCWTSAGVTAGIDLALSLVADDLGDDVARTIAQWMVMFVRRPGGQSQFSAQLSIADAADPPIRRVQDWIPDHLAEDLTVPVLARQAGMSERHFARRFREELGTTPAAHVEALRVEAAKQLLLSGDVPIAEVACRCGFGTVETFHRAFRRATGTTPHRYRHYFARELTPA